MTNEKKAHDLTIGFLNYVFTNGLFKLHTEEGIAKAMDEYLNEYNHLYSMMFALLENQ